jgi:hypothetical protein
MGEITGKGTDMLCFKSYIDPPKISRNLPYNALIRTYAVKPTKG